MSARIVLKVLTAQRIVFFLRAIFNQNQGSAIDVQVEETALYPKGAVILVVDGFGASYVYPEYTAYAPNGTLLGQVNP